MPGAFFVEVLPFGVCIIIYTNNPTTLKATALMAIVTVVALIVLVALGRSPKVALYVVAGAEGSADADG